MSRNKKPGRGTDQFENYVEHPRFGRKPILTGINPTPGQPGIYFHWRTNDAARVPNTAVPANWNEQRATYSHISFYFDERRVCRDCDRPFLFFAAEQKHWYEVLKFPLDANCVRCPECRREIQQLRVCRERYEELVKAPNRSLEEQVDLIDCLLTLIDAELFSRKQLPHVRQLLNQLSDRDEAQSRVRKFRKMLSILEERLGEGI